MNDLRTVIQIEVMAEIEREYGRRASERFYVRITDAINRGLLLPTLSDPDVKRAAGQLRRRQRRVGR